MVNNNCLKAKYPVHQDPLTRLQKIFLYQQVLLEKRFRSAIVSGLWLLPAGSEKGRRDSRVCGGRRHGENGKPVRSHTAGRWCILHKNKRRGATELRKGGGVINKRNQKSAYIFIANISLKVCSSFNRKSGF